MEWLLKPLAWIFAWRPRWRDAVGTLVLRVREHFYVILAIIFVVAGTVDQFVRPFSTGLSNASFDWLMRHRPIAYVADPAIMVLDIDEASLAKLGSEYGRWPWPREILAKVAGRIEAAGAQVVMFDILFADRDVANPHSEEVFDKYVKSSSRSFYPLVRLNPLNDGGSEIKMSDLNFVERDKESKEPEDASRTIALIPPYFKSIVDSSRMGTNNIQPDADNVIRKYPNYELLAGYRVPSIPYRVARDLGWARPAGASSVINWPRTPSSYTTVPFVRAYRALGPGDGGFFAQFAGKIVLIGSTAADLNDIKATPVDSTLPGIYVLATALDNLKHGAFLHPLPPWLIWAIETSLIGAAAFLFSRTAHVDRVGQHLLLIPVILLGLALVSVSFGTLLLDLSVPLAAALTYFAIAQIFRKLDNDFVAGSETFAFTARESLGRDLEVAALPESLSRDAIVRLIRMNVGVKLWEPSARGLGKPWVAQGWLLWRWSQEEPTSDAKGLVAKLRWIRVSVDSASLERTALAQAVATALHDKTQQPLINST